MWSTAITNEAANTLSYILHRLPPLNKNAKKVFVTKRTVFPWIIAGGDYFFFAQKGAIIQGKAIIWGRRLF